MCADDLDLESITIEKKIIIMMRVTEAGIVGIENSFGVSLKLDKKQILIIVMMKEDIRMNKHMRE